MTEPDLAGRRIMVVEDEMLIAMMLELALADAGCHVVGPFGRLSDAVVAARTEAVDGALLDINLAGESVFPAAEALEQRGVPFLLVSGYGRDLLPPDRRHWQVCAKPFRMNDVLETLADLVRRQPAPH